MIYIIYSEVLDLNFRIAMLTLGYIVQGTLSILFPIDNQIYNTGGLDRSLVGDVRLNPESNSYETLGESTRSMEMTESSPYEVPYTIDRNETVSPYQAMSSSRAGSMSASVTHGVSPGGYPIPAPYEGMVWLILFCYALSSYI